MRNYYENNKYTIQPVSRVDNTHDNGYIENNCKYFNEEIGKKTFKELNLSETKVLLSK